ncbi:MAG: hypothetical protein R3C01_01090 [Planctomycetaceae bacterium]
MCATTNILLILLLLGMVVPATQAQEDFEGAPIEYSASEPSNRISRLQQQLDRKEVSLDFHPSLGYLPAVLKALDIPAESQALVFSKTSLQLRRISPRTPRAIYFRDDVYIGFCQEGEVIEVSAVDPQLGTVFYTIDQQQTETIPRFERRVDSCLVCHASSRTEGVPGHLVRSLYVETSGHPMLSAGSRSVNHTTPFDQRWGGWYVTGKHGDQVHLGNLILGKNDHPNHVDKSAGQNLTSLAGLVDTKPYLTPHSDIVSLMMLEHQVLVHNRIANASFTTRQALAYNEIMNKALGNAEENRLDSTTRRIQSAGDKLVESLLFVDEAPLTAPVTGTSGYAEVFAKAGPRDGQNRSLRDLDLTRRMFKYPCSYLIYSDAFQQLPAEMLGYVWQRLDDVLSGKADSPKFAHISPADRKAIREILIATHPALPESWRAE